LTNKFNDFKSIVELDSNPRIPVWINTLEMIKDHPFLGVGVSQWQVNYPLYFDRRSKDVLFNEKTQLKRVHNDYLEQYSNLGLIGFFCGCQYCITTLYKSLSESVY